MATGTLHPYRVRVDSGHIAYSMTWATLSDAQRDADRVQRAHPDAEISTSVRDNTHRTGWIRI